MANNSGEIRVNMPNEADIKAAEEQLRRVMSTFKKNKVVGASLEDLDRYLGIVSGEFICEILEDDQESLLHKSADCCEYRFIQTLLKNIPQNDRLDLMMRRRKLTFRTYLYSLCNTALHRAIKSNHRDHEKTVKALLSPLTSAQKIELLSTHDSLGRTPTDLSQERGKLRISRYLIEQKTLAETESMRLQNTVRELQRVDAERQGERDQQQQEVTRMREEIQRMQLEINRQHAVIHFSKGGGEGGFSGGGKDGGTFVRGSGEEAMGKNGVGSGTQSMPIQERPIANDIDSTCGMINNVVRTKILDTRRSLILKSEQQSVLEKDIDSDESFELVNHKDIDDGGISEK